MDHGQPGCFGSQCRWGMVTHWGRDDHDALDRSEGFTHGLDPRWVGACGAQLPFALGTLYPCFYCLKCFAHESPGACIRHRFDGA